MDAVRATHSHGWLYKFYPLILFGFLVVGATIGLAGMARSK